MHMHVHACTHTYMHTHPHIHADVHTQTGHCKCNEHPTLTPGLSNTAVRLFLIICTEAQPDQALRKPVAHVLPHLLLHLICTLGLRLDHAQSYAQQML